MSLQIPGPHQVILRLQFIYEFITVYYNTVIHWALDEFAVLVFQSSLQCVHPHNNLLRLASPFFGAC